METASRSKRLPFPSLNVVVNALKKDVYSIVFSPDSNIYTRFHDDYFYINAKKNITVTFVVCKRTHAQKNDAAYVMCLSTERSNQIR